MEDADIFAALVRVMRRRAPAELTLREVAQEAGITAGALVQRFGSKRAMLHAHAKHAASDGDAGMPSPGTLLELADMYASSAASPWSAIRNLTWLLNDLSDPKLRRNLQKMSRRAHQLYEQMVTCGTVSGELEPSTDPSTLARLIEATLRGSFLSWAIYQEGAAADWMRSDLEALLGPWRKKARSGTKTKLPQRA